MTALTASLPSAAAAAAAATLASPAASLASPPSPSRSLLRFLTCGSVDDGKSTLIGRLLFEAGAVMEDQLTALDRDSAALGTVAGGRDFALLVDGLAAERQQGITIDVAYRYFSTPKRAFIVADTPGHEQYTRNMATGASGCDCAIILVDASQGVLPQTRRHFFIAAKLGISHLVIAINKMDRVNFDQAVFLRIKRDFLAATADWPQCNLHFMPVVARDGDNIAANSPRLAWYQGPALLPWLEAVAIAPAAAITENFVLPVQYICRPDENFRGYGGRLAAGSLRIGDAVMVLPSRQISTISAVVTMPPLGDPAAPGSGSSPAPAAGSAPAFVAAQKGESLMVVLADERDIARGDVLVGLPAGAASLPSQAPQVTTQFTAELIITGSKNLRPGQDYEIRLGTARAQAKIIAVHDKIDIGNLTRQAAENLSSNDIGRVTLRLDRPLVVQPYDQSRMLGGFILIDRGSNETSAIGLVEQLVSPAPTGAAATRPVWHRLVGATGTVRRQKFWQFISWRGVSALGVVLLCLGFGLPVAVTLGLIAADLVARPLLRRLHDLVWRRHGIAHEKSDFFGQDI